jgi:hypothetical protein
MMQSQTDKFNILFINKIFIKSYQIFIDGWYIFLSLILFNYLFLYEFYNYFNNFDNYILFSVYIFNTSIVAIIFVILSLKLLKLSKIQYLDAFRLVFQKFILLVLYLFLLFSTLYSYNFLSYLLLFIYDSLKILLITIININYTILSILSIISNSLSFIILYITFKYLIKSYFYMSILLCENKELFQIIKKSNTITNKIFNILYVIFVLFLLLKIIIIIIILLLNENETIVFIFDQAYVLIYCIINTVIYYQFEEINKDNIEIN